MRQLLELTRNSFDASERGLGLLPTILRTLVVAVAVVLLTWLMKPDLFGLIPNSLDPMFYTGYTINLDDALAAAGNRHYFVTRWTSYMPAYLFSEVFGPYWGRLVLRLAMVLVLSELLWRLGRQVTSCAVSRLSGIFTVITAPMFLRAFTTDYPEYFIIWGSMVLIILCFSENMTMWRSFFIGATAVSLIIANPFAVFVVAFTVSLGMLYVRRDLGYIKLLIRALVAAFAAFAVVSVGYFQFKYRYGIGNVYEPTLKFAEMYTRPEKDEWVAPTKEWFKYFSWLYLTPLLALFALYLNGKFKGEMRRKNNYIALLSLLVYLLHLFFEMRSGHAMETSFYWSMSLAPTLILLFLVTLELSKKSTHTWMYVSTATVMFLILLKIPQKFQFSAGISLFVLLFLVSAFVLLVNRYLTKMTVLLLSALVLWMQIGAPTYAIRTNGGDLNSPQYDLVYSDQNQISRDIQNETIWFLDQLDRFKNDWTSTFLTAGGWSAAIVGSYVPHPFSRWITSISQENVLSPNVRDELEFGYRPLLVMYGDPMQVEDLKLRVSSELPRSRELLDVTHNKALGYRLVVMSGNTSGIGDSVIAMSRLDRSIGKVQKNGSVVVASGTPEGFVSFGPYFGLGEGSYTATLLFESLNVEDLGYFEVFNDKNSAIKREQLQSLGSGYQTSTVSFRVKRNSGTWQFRTVYNGTTEVTFKAILLRKIEYGK